MLDLRRVPRKRALAVLSEARAADPAGRVCAWVRATEDGTPVFTPDPSRLLRLTAPAVIATALAACSTTHVEPVTPVAIAARTPSSTSGGNTNTVPGVVTVAIAASTPPAPVQAQAHPATNIQPVEIEMAGDMAF